MNLFGATEYIFTDSTDLTKYILGNYPETKTNVESFKQKWYYLLASRAKDGKDFVRLLMVFDILTGCRRRLEQI